MTAGRSGHPRSRHPLDGEEEQRDRSRAVFAWRDGWELRVMVGDETLVSDRCDRTQNAFVIADRWLRRLEAQAWQQIVPATRERA